MNPSNDPREQQKEYLSGTAFIPGLVLVGIGVLFLLDNLHILQVANVFAYWPVILIAVGLVKLVDSSFTAGRIAGGVLIGVGAIILGDNLGYYRVEDWWPLILIAIGIWMLWRRTHPGADNWWWNGNYRSRMFMRDRWARRTDFRGNMMHEYAIFGATRRIVTDQDFKGGRVSAVFGGTYLDLTGANMQGNTAVLEMSSVYGGATVRIPTSWNLEMHGAGIFGGFIDRTVHPPQSPDMKHLIVRGAAVFGGVTFKN